MKLNKSLIQITIIFCLFLVVFAAIFCEAKQPKIEGNKLNKQFQDDKNYKKQTSYNNDNINLFQQNEIDDRITLNEPLKSMVQMTARVVLSQTKLQNHINIDTAMNVLNDASFMLSKPSTLFKVVKLLTLTVASILLSSFFFPGTYKLIEKTWRDPSSLINLDKFMKSNGIYEISIVNLLTSQTTDELLNKIGLKDNSCKKVTLCYFGEIIRSSFPQPTEAIIKFSSNNLTFFKDNKYFESFLVGFKDQNCNKILPEINEQQAGNECFGNILNSFVVSRFGNKQQKDKFQTIQASRA